MPILGSFAAGGKGGYGRGGKKIISLDYLIVAGGSGANNIRPGGAGGQRFSAYGPSPLNTGTQIEMISGTDYPITIGAGGAANAPQPDLKGHDSEITINEGTITATGGGPGANDGTGTGGCGGGADGRGGPRPINTGNEGGFSPPEGQDGGLATPGVNVGSGGGGTGSDGTSSSGGGHGGSGVSVSITGSSVTRGGGGGGGSSPGTAAGSGGPGGGGNGGPNTVAGSPGAANTGGGAGAGGDNIPGGGATGGSGIVVLRAPADNSFTVTPGTNTTSTAPDGTKVATFTVSGTVKVS